MSIFSDGKKYTKLVGFELDNDKVAHAVEYEGRVYAFNSDDEEKVQDVLWSGAKELADKITEGISEKPTTKPKGNILEKLAEAEKKFGPLPTKLHKKVK